MQLAPRATSRTSPATWKWPPFSYSSNWPSIKVRTILTWAQISFARFTVLHVIATHISSKYSTVEHLWHPHLVAIANLMSVAIWPFIQKFIPFETNMLGFQTFWQIQKLPGDSWVFSISPQSVWTVVQIVNWLVVVLWLAWSFRLPLFWPLCFSLSVPAPLV